MNGIVGYVRAEELEADYDVPPEEDVIISVYDLDGFGSGHFCPEWAARWTDNDYTSL